MAVCRCRHQLQREWVARLMFQQAWAGLVVTAVMATMSQRIKWRPVDKGSNATGYLAQSVGGGGE